MRARTASGFALATAALAASLLWSPPALAGGAVRYETHKLVASDGAPEDEFGSGVDVDGDVIAVGASRHGASGAVYVFRRFGDVWTEEAKLTVPDARGFGSSVDVDGDTIAVCASGDGVQPNTGLAYVFVHQNGAWIQQARLFAPDGEPWDGFGRVALVGDHLLVGANLAETGATNSGWSHRAVLAGQGFAPASTVPVVVVRSPSFTSSDRGAFGDGVRCVGAPVVRMSVAPALAGVSTHTVGHGAAAGTFAYQLWFRSSPEAYCTAAAFNLSNGRTLSW